MLVRALNQNSWRLRGLAIAGLLCVPLVPLVAQSPEDDSGQPDRGVARISLINGDVSVRRGDSGDWVAAAPNAPLVVEDRILTGARSRAEVQFDYANFVRLAPDTEVRVAELEYRRYLLQVASGTVMFRVLRDSDADAEISTQSVSLHSVADAPTLLAMIELTRRVPIASHVLRHAVDLVVATHPDAATAPDLVRRYVRFGASPRGAQAMVLAGKVAALLDGRPSVSIADIREVAVAALRHRMVVGYEATADNIDAAQIVDALLTTVAEPTAGMRGAP